MNVEISVVVFYHTWEREGRESIVIGTYHVAATCLYYPYHILKRM